MFNDLSKWLNAGNLNAGNLSGAPTFLGYFLVTEWDDSTSKIAAFALPPDPSNLFAPGRVGIRYDDGLEHVVSKEYFERELKPRPFNPQQELNGVIDIKQQTALRFLDDVQTVIRRIIKFSDPEYLQASDKATLKQVHEEADGWANRCRTVYFDRELAHLPKLITKLVEAENTLRGIAVETYREQRMLPLL